MALWHEVEEDVTFTNDSDPVLNKLKRTAGAAIVQDIMLGTYWANTVGKTKYPGVYDMYLRELKENLRELMASRMSYRNMEDFMVTLGYEIGDIRCAFQKETGLDPVKLEYMRVEDVKNTPSNIPWYNCGWGLSKKGKSSYFVMPHVGGIFVVFHQKDDMNREEKGSFLRCDEALAYLKGVVKKVHRYDQPAEDMVEDALAPDVKEPKKHDYKVVANYLHDLGNRGELDEMRAKSIVRDAVMGGKITDEEGDLMLRLYAADEGAVVTPDHAPEAQDAGMGKKLKDAQTKRKVKDEMEDPTPQKFFDKIVEKAEPDRVVDEVATKYIKSVLSYVKHKASDINDFDVKLHSLEYRQHPEPRTMIEVDPESGETSSAPKATISVILEITDNTLPTGESNKFALGVFFVGKDGDVTTSDSIKGEDDIIYGFTEEGLRQYFSKERMTGARGLPK